MMIIDGIFGALQWACLSSLLALEIIVLQLLVTF